MRMNKAGYFLSSAARWLSPQARRCPNCGSPKYATVDRKYTVTTLRRCGACHLLYRAPADNAISNRKFYQTAYHEGFTTDLPDEKSLQNLIDLEFAQSPKSYSYYISVLKD